jgi:hypothetical protein
LDDLRLSVRHAVLDVRLFLFAADLPAVDVRRTARTSAAGNWPARCVPATKAAVEAFLDSSARVNRQIFDEDHAICARVSPFYDLTSPDRIFAPGEERVARLHAVLTAMTTEKDQT